MTKWLSPLLAVFILACGTPKAIVGTNDVAVPPDSAARCTAHCDRIGMKLNSVVIMVNTVGCVCTAAPSSPVPEASAAAGGASAAMIAQQAAIVMQQRRQQQN